LSRPDISLLHKTGQVRKRKIDLNKIDVWLSDKNGQQRFYCRGEESREEETGYYRTTPGLLPQDSR
jgi:hypothetical protein